MNLMELNKLEEKANMLEIRNGIGLLIRTLPYTSITRYYTINEESWEKMKIKTKGELFKKIMEMMVVLEHQRSSDKEFMEAVENQILVTILYLYPKEFTPIYKKSKSRLDVNKKKFLEMTRILLLEKSTTENLEELV